MRVCRCSSFTSNHKFRPGARHSSTDTEHTYITSSTNPCMVGNGKTMGVILKPDCWNLYKYRHLRDLKCGRYKTFPCYQCHTLEPRVAKYEARKTGYLLKDGINIMLGTCIRVLNI